MRIRVKSLTALLFAMWPVISTTAQVTEQWVARYDGPYNGPDYVKAIAVDQTTGNVYVTGQSWGGNPANAYTTVAYDSRGNQLWLARYSGPGNLDDRASAIAVDSATGNIYVTGESWGGGSSSDWDYATVAYDSNGNQLWVARYNGAGNSRDSATAIAVGGDGNVYVTGWSWGGDSKVDYATVAYDSGGSQLWAARYNGPGNGDDYALAIAVDVGGNVYVTGYSWGGSSDYDYATVAYDSAGNQLWVARYNGPENGIDQATAIAVDNSTRNVYITGGSSRGFAFLDFATVAYDLDGNQLWVKRYHGPGNGRDIARAIAVDAGGNVYVTGESWESASGSAYATIAYDSSGNPLWIARYSGS